MTRLEELARDLVKRLKSTIIGEHHYEELDRLLTEIAAEREAYADVVDRAHDVYGSDDVNVDAEPILSVSDEGVWVSAWVWVPDEDGKED